MLYLLCLPGCSVRDEEKVKKTCFVVHQLVLLINTQNLIIQCLASPLFELFYPLSQPIVNITP